MKRNTFLSINVIVLFAVFFVANNLFISHVQAHDFDIFVESPADGDEWEIGKDQTIEWSDNNHHDANDHAIILWLSTAAGEDSVAIDTVPIPDYEPGGGSLTWTVSGDVSEECRIYLRHISDDDEVFGKGGMEQGDYFSMLPGTAIKVNDHTPQFSLFQQTTNSLQIKLYDVNGRMVWETDNGSSFKDLQKRLKNGTYLVMYDYSSKRFTQKINLVR